MKKYIDSFMKYRFLLNELIKKGIKLKYRRSYLGILWTLIEPLLTMIVLTIVFGTLLGRQGETSAPYPVYILSGRLLYSYFSSSTKVSMRSIRANASMIKKVYVPKYLYPLSATLYNYVIFLISLIVLAVVSAIMGVDITWHIIEGIIPLIVLLIFSFGVSMILATVAVFFRDLEYLWDVILMLIMYSSAIFYYYDSLKGVARMILKYNPLFCIITVFRGCVIEGTSLFTGYTYGLSNIKMLGYSCSVSIVVLVIGIYIFYKNQDKFILQI
ncbi:MAG: ABC transporter permease [Eubacterium sp.]